MEFFCGTAPRELTRLRFDRISSRLAQVNDGWEGSYGRIFEECVGDCQSTGVRAHHDGRGNYGHGASPGHRHP